MMKEAIATASTIEAAIEAAKQELNAPEYADISIEILETPTKKALGIFGGAPAKARAYYEESDFTQAETYIRGVLSGMGVTATVLTMEEDEGVRFAIDCGEDDGYIIGRRGETLDALQYLVRLVVSRGAKEYYRVSVNVGDYREQREQSLLDLAQRSAGKAKKYGHNVTLAPMTPYDRRIVHTAIQNMEGVSSFSVGEGSERRVVVAPDEAYRKGGNRGGYQRGGQHDRGPGPRGGGRGYGNSGGGYQRDERYGGGNRYGSRDGGGGFQRDREGGYNRDRDRDGGGDRYNRDRGPGGPGQDYRGRGGGNRGSNPPSSAPNRPPRSDASTAGRYGRIEPKHEDKDES
ncbi:MAG: protein jag [Oscillospiraceae bacterium]|nr:protein jag [Oscillospiraceae bacterium]